MRSARFVLFVLLVLVLIVSAWMAFRTARAECDQPDGRPATPIVLDTTGATQRLADAVRFKTISFPEASLVDPTAFTEFHRFLERSFPRVHRVLTREVVNRYSVIYTWTGTDPSRRPILLLAHQDVVPLEPGTEGDWTHPPFAGRIADGYVWGRGALNDKGSLLGILEAVEYLLAEGFQPVSTIYLAFGHDEGPRGLAGAAQIARLLRSRGVMFDFVLDEGLVITDGIIPGVAPRWRWLAPRRRGG